MIAGEREVARAVARLYARHSRGAELELEAAAEADGELELVPLCDPDSPPWRRPPGGVRRKSGS